MLDILEHLGAARRPVSVSDLARATGFNVSTAFRLLQTLVSRGYVEQQPGHRSYVLGPRVYQLASAYLKGSDLATLARPHLEALRDVLGETVYLVILSQGEIVQLCKADGQHVVSASMRSARARAGVLHRDRQGAALRPRARGVPAATSRACGCAPTPRRRSRAARSSSARSRPSASEGYALDVEEYAENLCCVSVPVRDPNSGATVAAVSVAMPKIRFKRSLVPRWRKLLEQKAALISPQLGLIDA